MSSDHTSMLSTAQRVIDAEVAGLEALRSSLGPAFGRAVDLILGASGRVILSGMGKSGHIARKIAATMASTGTPSFFVHPSEASHGDLGMLATGDVLLLLSNSGDTPEIVDLVAHSSRFGIPLIGVCANEHSLLAREADVALLLPNVPEACGLGIVPTTSTTMCLALGDALAVALMEHRAFTPDQFRAFHPGGKLGQQLARVQDLMHVGEAMPLVTPETPMTEALVEMSRKGFGVVGAVEAGKLRGIITDGDLRRHIVGLLDRSVEEVMTADPQTIPPDALAEKAAALMEARQITSLFVTDAAESVVGILNVHDCLRAGVR